WSDPSCFLVRNFVSSIVPKPSSKTVISVRTPCASIEAGAKLISRLIRSQSPSGSESIITRVSIPVTAIVNLPPNPIQSDGTDGRPRWSMRGVDSRERVEISRVFGSAGGDAVDVGKEVRQYRVRRLELRPVPDVVGEHHHVGVGYHLGVAARHVGTRI